MPVEIDSIIRSSRRSVAVEITREGEIIVRAPYLASMKSIEQFVRCKEQWIRRTREFVRRKRQKQKQISFAEGDVLLYKGTSFPLKIVDKQKTPLVFRNEAFFILRSETYHARELFTVWYKKQALRTFINRVEYYAHRFRLNYSSVKLSTAHRRWGSCSRQGTLRFNWLLIMAPRKVIDYVIVHETAHLKERNHGKNFWKLVEHMLPEYKKHRKWLRENDTLLTI